MDALGGREVMLHRMFHDQFKDDEATCFGVDDSPAAKFEQHIRQEYGDEGFTPEGKALLGCLVGFGVCYADDLPQKGGFGGAGMTTRLRTIERRTVKVCMLVNTSVASGVVDGRS